MLENQDRCQVQIEMGVAIPLTKVTDFIHIYMKKKWEMRVKEE